MMPLKRALRAGLAFATFGAGLMISLAAGAEPDLSLVSIAGRDPLTHAQVKKVLPDGILFVADQGLVKARFDQLAPEWQAEYGDDAHRAATKAASNASETAANLKAREVAARPVEQIDGEVESKNTDGVLIIYCAGPAVRYPERPPSDYFTRIGMSGGAAAVNAANRPPPQFSMSTGKSTETPAPAVVGTVALRDPATYQRVQVRARLSLKVKRSGEDYDDGGRQVPLYTLVN